MNKLIIHGWFFFFRFLILIFREFFKKIKKYVDEDVDEEISFMIQTDLKNFYKDKNLNWKDIIDKSLLVSIDEKEIIEVISWENYRFFNSINN